MLAFSELSSLQSGTTVGNKWSCTDEDTQILFLCGSENSSSGKLDMVSVILSCFLGVFVPSLCGVKCSLQRIFVLMVHKNSLEDQNILKNFSKYQISLR